MSKTLKITLISSIILLLFMLSTDPRQLPSVLLIVPFLLLFFVLTLLAVLGLGYLEVAKTRRVRMGVVIAAIPVLLLVLQSLGQLTMRDTLVVFLLFGVGYFYVARFGVRVPE